MEPEVVKVKQGWAALARTWAVFGTTREEALTRFKEPEHRHKEIEARPEPQPIGE